jgi:hypothetical protein
MIKHSIDGVKVSTCFYSGFFLIRYLTPKKDSAGDLKSFISDYCGKYQSALTKRTAFVS